MKNKILKIVTVLTLLSVLTMTNFIYVGTELISYAVDGNDTVEFNAELNEGENVLLSINAPSVSDFYNGVITLREGESNFKFARNQSNQYVKSIEDKRIILNTISAGTRAQIDLKIEPIKDDIFNIGLLDMSSKINFSGNYKDSKGQENAITQDKEVKYEYTVNNTNENIESTAKIITNKIVKVSGEDKRVVQLEMNLGLKENNYPIKEIELNMDVPSVKSETGDSAYVNPSVKTKVDLNTMTHWESKHENNRLNIKFTNEPQGNKILWKKQGSEKVVISFIFDKDVKLDGDHVEYTNPISDEAVGEPRLKVTLYDGTELNTTGTLKVKDVDDKLNQEQLVEVTAKNTENTIYKGNLDAGIDREFTTKTKIAVNLANAEEYMNVNEENNYIVNGREVAANVVFNKTTISKKEFDKVLGEDGKITFLNEDNEELATVNKNANVDANNNIVVDYLGREPRKLVIKTTIPKAQGNIVLTNTKTIKSQDKETVKSATELSTKITYEYLTNLSKEAKENIKLEDTKTEANLTSTVENFSTLNESKNVQFTAKLLSDNEVYELYKNPTIDIIIPGIFKVDVKNVTLLNFQDQFKLSHNVANENGNTVIHITLSGEQKIYANTTDNGINVVVSADISASNILPSQNAEIIMKYTNENKTGETLETKLPVRLNSKEGTLIVNKISGYRNDEVTENIDQEKTIKLDANVEEKTLTNEVYFINNNGQAMKNPTIILQFPGKINESTFVNTYKGFHIEGDTVDVKYSDNVDEEKDSQKWMDKETIQEKKLSVRAVKISLKSQEIGESKVIKLTYQYNISKDLKDTDKSYNKASIFYAVNDIEASISSKFNFTVNAESEEDKKDREVQENNEQQNNEETSTKQDKTEELKIEQVATSGDKVISADTIVSEGQGIKYTIKLTNLKNEAVDNVKLVATNKNAIYFNNIKTTEKIFNRDEEVEHYREDSSLKSKELNIGTIRAGETKQISYQIAVAEVSDDNQILSGEIKLTGDGIQEQKIEMQSNKIANGSLKANLEFAYDENVYLGSGDGFSLLLTVKNITDNKLENVKVTIPLSEKLSFSTKYIDQDYTDAEFVEKKNNDVIFNIPTIESGKEAKIGIKLIINDISKNEEKVNISQYFIANINNRDYTSNYVEKTAYNNAKHLDIKLSSNVTGNTVKNGQNIIYYIDVKNNETEELAGTLSDEIPYELFVNSVKKENEEITLDTKILTDEISLKAGESIRYTIDGTLNSDYANSDKITNFAQIEGTYITVKSNELTYAIEGKTQDDQKDNDSDTPSGENQDTPNDVDNNNPSDNSKEDSESKNKTYSISGVAFEDVNDNGMRDANEPLLSGISVLLMDEATGKIALDKDNKSMETITSSKGAYSFTNLVKGKYTVLFKFDASNYNTAEYKKSGIDESNNSDVVYKDVSINNSTSAYASTETLNLSESDLTNIDAGFVKRKKFDLKLDKTITKTIVQNGEGTKQVSYDGTKLAKVEIRSKQIANTTVIIEYTINVTNEGELAGFASEIIDYIPNGLKFTSEMNTNWYQGTDGNLLNRELANTIINPGETKSIKLTLSKAMTASNTGTFMNSAEINKASNKNSTNDIDSTPGNKELKEDDYSTAELIISIGTGSVVVNVLIIATVIVVIGAGTFLIKKKVLNREND